MKIVIAPDSFKESLSADQCCQAIKAGFSAIFPDAEYICLPVADGGEGTLNALLYEDETDLQKVKVCNPLGQRINAHYGIIDDV